LDTQSPPARPGQLHVLRPPFSARGRLTYQDGAFCPHAYITRVAAAGSHACARRKEGRRMENWTKRNPAPVWDE